MRFAQYVFQEIHEVLVVCPFVDQMTILSNLPAFLGTFKYVF